MGNVPRGRRARQPAAPGVDPRGASPVHYEPHDEALDVRVAEVMQVRRARRDGPDALRLWREIDARRTELVEWLRAVEESDGPLGARLGEQLAELDRAIARASRDSADERGPTMRQLRELALLADGIRVDRVRKDLVQWLALKAKRARDEGDERERRALREDLEQRLARMVRNPDMRIDLVDLEQRARASLKARGHRTRHPDTAGRMIKLVAPDLVRAQGTR